MTTEEYCAKHEMRRIKNQSLDLTIKYSNSKEKNHWWKGGVSEYKDHSTLKRHRLIILEKATYKCSECNKKATVVHHLDGSKDNHSLENLMALCQKCHTGIYHKGSNGRKPKYGKISVRKIAVEAGCSFSTAYNHLKGAKISKKYGEKIDQISRGEKDA
jgi:cytochrome c2